MLANRRSRQGFTLIEVLVAMTILLSVLGMATNMFRKQGSVIVAQAGRLEAQQTAQFTLSALERELRLAGVGVVDMQPILAQAAKDAITFNADITSNVTGDPSAVYIDPDAADENVSVFLSTNKKLLPNSDKFYPDSTYMRSAGVPSGAETISLWLSVDSTAPRSDEHILWRRINNGPARVVAKGIIKGSADTIFQYFKGDTAGFLTAIASNKLPLYHNAATHGQPSDTGAFSLVDSIRTVRVRMTVVFHDRKGDVYRRLDHTIRLMNSGLIRRSTCGDPPIGVSPQAVASVDTIDTEGVLDFNPKVTISWPKSTDEGGGEKDVERYAVYRRPAGAPPTLDQPFASIPAGSSSYSFIDHDVVTGEQWVYGVASQDCTPRTSGLGVTPTITIP